MLPSLAQIATASEDFFVIEDVHNFGADYDTTLMAWHKNFTEAWPSLKASYDETFRRMWNYYLLIVRRTLPSTRNSALSSSIIKTRPLGRLCLGTIGR